MSGFIGLPPTNAILVLKNDPTSAQDLFLFQFDYFYSNAVQAVKSYAKIAHKALISFKLLLQKME